MNQIKIHANAKINLTLDILGKREDGYHNIQSIMQSVDLADTVLIEKTHDRSIQICSDSTYIPLGSDNLAYRAVSAFLSSTGMDNQGFRVTIEKKIPVAAGLAGGSADAAAVIFGLNRLMESDCSTADLKKIGKTIGADVPFCLTGGTMLAQGVGEILTPVDPIPACHILIAKPTESVSTSEAYQNYDRFGCKTHPQTDMILNALKQKNLRYVAENLCNVMEEVVTVKEVHEIEASMLRSGALGSRMSGSGSSVFGIFEYLFNAEKCACELNDRYRQIFIASPANKGCEIVEEQ